MALLLTNTLKEEIEERQREEKNVQARRKRLGAGSEKEVRRAVGRDVLAASKVSPKNWPCRRTVLNAMSLFFSVVAGLL